MGTFVRMYGVQLLWKTVWQVLKTSNRIVVVQPLSRVQLCDPMTVAHQTPVHGILQARILGWVVVSSSRGSSRPRDRTHASCTGRRILYY